MPIFQGVVFLTDGNAGWSETYYHNAADYTTALGQLNTINDARMALSIDDVKAVGVRVSDVTIKGDALVGNPTTPAGTLAAGTDHTYDVNVALLVRFFTADNLNRLRHFIRGISDGDILTGALPTWAPRAGTVTLINNYITAVKANSVAWITRTIRPPVTKVIGSGATFVNLTVRKVGRPFGLPRGRRMIV